MERPEKVETDPFVDNIVPVPEGDEQFAKAVGELPQDQGLDGRAGPGMPLEAEDGHDGPPPQGAAGVDAQQGQATGNGHVAATSGPPTGPMQGIAEASAAQPAQNPVPAVVLPAQPLSEWRVRACIANWHDARRLEPVSGSVRVLYTHTDAISAHGILASASWTDDAHANNCNRSDGRYDHGHTIVCGICSAGWPGLPGVSRSTCTNARGICLFALDMVLLQIISTMSARHSKIHRELGCTAIPTPDKSKSGL